MPRDRLPAVTPKRTVWNSGRIVGQKRPLLPKQVWAIRARLELANNWRGPVCGPYNKVAGVAGQPFPTTVTNFTR